MKYSFSLLFFLIYLSRNLAAFEFTKNEDISFRDFNCEFYEYAIQLTEILTIKSLENENDGEIQHFCPNWIFILNDNYVGSKNIVPEYSEHCYAQQLYRRESQQMPTTQLLLSNEYFKSYSTSTNISHSYYNRELELDEILNSLKFKILRFTKCLSLLFDGISVIQPELLQSTTEVILFNRLARPHQDRFIYLFNTEKALQEFKTSSSSKMKNLRFGYEMLIQNNNSKIISESLRVLNYWCNQAPDEINSVKSCQNILNGRHFHMSHVKSEILRYINYPNGTRKSGAGFHYTILETAIFLYNFTIDIKIASYKGIAGFKDKNGIWKGAVGDILSGEVDFALTGVTMERKLFFSKLINRDSLNT